MDRTHVVDQPRPPVLGNTSRDLLAAGGIALAGIAVAGFATVVISELLPDRPHDLTSLVWRYLAAATIYGLVLGLFMLSQGARARFASSLMAAYGSMGSASLLVAGGMWLAWFSSGSYVQPASNLGAVLLPIALSAVGNLFTAPLGLRWFLGVNWAAAIALAVPVVMLQILGLIAGFWFID